MSAPDQDGVPQWKSWYRWPFLALVTAGTGMAWVGVSECVALWSAISSGAPDIVVETAMSAFPPLGVAFIALGSLAFFPRKHDGTGIRPIRTRRGATYNPGKVVMLIVLAGVLLYPICGIALRTVTTALLTDRGYAVVTSQVSHTSGYGTVHWRRAT